MGWLGFKGSTSWLVAAVGLVLWTAIPVAIAQDEGADPAIGAVDDESDIATGDLTVEVDSPTDDREIADRLTRILQSTERFTRPAVRVENGVVFLSGETDDPSNREWASELAKNTQGVAAVVNNITLKAEPLWTLQPALRELRMLWQDTVRITPLIVIGLVILCIAFFASRIAVTAARRPLQRRVQSELVRGVILKLVAMLIMVFGVYLFLRISNLTTLAATLLGGTGLLGLALGFAFRDIAENFLASILISIQRPFRIRDTIEVSGHTGVVQKVTMRETVLMDFDGNHIQIANATVYKDTIRNFTANPKMRVGFKVGIGYDADLRDAQNLALDVLQEHSVVLKDPEPVVLIEELGAATVNLRIYFWINGHDHSKVKVKSSIMRLVLHAFENAGVSLPDEAREVIFPDGVPVQMLPERTDDDAGTGASRTTTPAVRRAGADDEEEEVTEAEGDLRSEVADIQRQAEASRSPEDSAAIMTADDDGGSDADAHQRSPEPVGH